MSKSIEKNYISLFKDISKTTYPHKIDNTFSHTKIQGPSTMVSPRALGRGTFQLLPGPLFGGIALLLT